jgi:hypothetical protein
MAFEVWRFCRIMQGGRCKSETADILFKYFGLKLVSDKKHKIQNQKPKEG